MNNIIKRIVKIGAVALGSIGCAICIEKGFEANRRKMAMDDSLNRANHRKDKNHDSKNY